MDLIGAYVRHMQAAGLSLNTIEDRDAFLRRIDRELPMGLVQATVEELEDWLARNGWKPATRASYYSHVTGLFRWARRRDLIDWDPSTALTRPRVPAGVPKPCADEDLAHAIRMSPDPWRRFIILAAYAGLRCCEIATVERRDIDQEEMTIRGKGGRKRTVPTWPQVWEVVERLPAGLVGEGYSAGQISRGGARHLRRIGLEKVTMHTFRHWFASTLLDQGTDIRVVQELLGHASLSMTAVYTQVNSKQRRAAVATLPVLVPLS